jgi:UDP-N-acetylglucosamine 2-epimerase (non-hydrolysing)
MKSDRGSDLNIPKLKVMTVVGTRPEIIRLSRVIDRLDRFTDHQLVHTGQNYSYELNEIFFKDLEIRSPDTFLNAAAETGAGTIGQVISSMGALLETTKPDAMLILGDTNSCLAAIAAKRARVPIFHMEAGNRCFDQRVPEEVNRRIIDHTADVNLAYSDIARENLLREGLPPDLSIKTGSPMFEVLEHYRPGIEASDVVARLGLEPDNFFLVSAHREENVDGEAQFGRLLVILDRLASRYGLPVIVSTHPRTQKRLEATGATVNSLVRFMKPLGFKDYNKLQICARAVLSDSGTITEESAILNFPALNMRETHERHEGMEEAAVMMTGFNFDRIIQGLEILAQQPRGGQRLIREVSDYSMPNVSDKVLRLIVSYTDYVRRVVWRQY